MLFVFTVGQKSKSQLKLKNWNTGKRTKIQKLTKQEYCFPQNFMYTLQCTGEMS